MTQQDRHQPGGHQGGKQPQKPAQSQPQTPQQQRQQRDQRDPDSASRPAQDSAQPADKPKQGQR